MQMLQAVELSMLRTKLRQVNVEYSALVRDKQQETRFVRMGELRNERRALMALISAASEKGQWGAVYGPIDAASQHAAGALPDA
jgi:hypothetical protein